MKTLKLFLVASAILIVSLSFGCSNRRYELIYQVDQLLASTNSEWVVGQDGKFYCEIPNGAVRVKSDGSVALITNLENSKYSMISISNPDGIRAAKVAKRFGINKLTKETIDSSYAIQDELINDAIISISNSLKSSIVFESPDGVKK